MLALSSPKIAVTVSIMAVVRVVPAKQNRMQGCTVKGRSNGAENRNPTDDFGQQQRSRPGPDFQLPTGVAERKAAPLTQQFSVSG
jgi:hypothetical protein